MLDLAHCSEEERARLLINALAPVTRRDAWWGTEGPVDIIREYLAAERALCARDVDPLSGTALDEEQERFAASIAARRLA